MEVTGASIASAGPDHDQGAAEEVWEDITEVSDAGVINSMHSRVALYRNSRCQLFL